MYQRFEPTTSGPPLRAKHGKGELWVFWGLFECVFKKKNPIFFKFPFGGGGGGDTGCLPFTWRNRLVDGLCKWKAKFPYWKFPFGVACTI